MLSDSGAPLPILWEEFRRQMPVTAEWAFLDHAAVAPLPDPTRRVMSRWLDSLAQNGGVAWKEWADGLVEVRRLAATLINARPEEIALVRNTTEGITLVAEGFPWQAGDNVVVPAGEFPSNLYPWMNLAARGVETRLIPMEGPRLDLARLRAACDARTRIVAASWVDYATGWRTDVGDLAEMAHRQGALLCLDAIQGLGAFPLDVRQTGVDFLAADSHKWMLGPEGAGVFFVREELLARLRPLGVGWNSVVQAGRFDDPTMTLRGAAARYEGGTYNMIGMHGMGASLQLLLDAGVERIAARVVQLTDELCLRLRSLGAELYSDRSPAGRSGIVSFNMPGRSPAQMQRACSKAGVAVNVRAGRLRVSPHAYNNQDDLERFLVVLATV